MGRQRHVVCGARRVLRRCWPALLPALLLGAPAVRASTFMPTPADQISAPKTRLAGTLSLARKLAALPAGQKYLAIDDMRFRRDQKVNKAGFIETGIWPNGVVTYAFDAGVTAAERPYFVQGARHWSAVCNVTFKERTTETDYILVKSLAGNWSEVGMIGGEQELSIHDWLSAYTIAHEVGHALGLWHEHSRTDRDTYVDVLTANIEPTMLYNFELEPMVMHGEYDFDSLMHYSRDAFSINGQNTLVPKPAYAQWLNLIGQTSHISVLDAQGMAWRYGGEGTLAAPQVTGALSFQNQQVDLSWTAITGASGYIIEYGENGDGPPYTTTHPGLPAPDTNVGQALSRSIEGLTRGIRYYFTVRATNGYLYSNYTKPIILRIPPIKVNDAYEPNDETATAYDLSAMRGRWLSTLHGRANFWDTDYYRITVPEGRLHVQALCRFAWVDGRLGLRLWHGSDWTPLAEAYVMEQDQQVIQMEVPAAGEYTLQVFGPTLGNNYDLWWDALPRQAAVSPGKAGWTAYH